MSISTHILDIARGRPARGVSVTLERKTDSGFEPVVSVATDDDGRVGDLVTGTNSEAGVFRISFGVSEYFRARGEECFYPEISVTFEIKNPGEHHHVPLLLSPFGYSTYRGS